MHSVEELVHIFEDHHKQTIEMNKKMIKEFKENNPGEPLPAWYEEEFNLPLALKSMCEEIVKLKAFHGMDK